MVLSLSDGGVTASHTGKGICSFFKSQTVIILIIVTHFSSQDICAVDLVDKFLMFNVVFTQPRHWSIISDHLHLVYKLMYCYSQIGMDILITILDLVK